MEEEGFQNSADIGSLKDSIRELSLGEEGDDFNVSYPERPGEPRCSYYMRTGRCDYGVKCHFDHPRNRVIGSPDSSGTEYPERKGQPVCQYFLKTGNCKFGISCKYHHPKREQTEVQLNAYGYPIRKGERDCSYYVKNGSCKFGATCKFNHPQPDATSVQESGNLFYPPALFPYQLSAMAGYQGALGPFGPVFLPSEMISVAGWNPYMPAISPIVHPGNQVFNEEGLLNGLAHQIPNRTTPVFYFPSSYGQKEPSLPERPDQPECQHYMKTGHCKFGSTCKFHHPLEKMAPKATCFLNPVGLPIRPGAQYCLYFNQNGVCKFGPSCKFDHSIEALKYKPLGTSPIDMPLGPFSFPPVISMPVSSFSPDLGLGVPPATAFDSSSVSLSTTQNPTQIPTSSSNSSNGCTSSVETR